MWASCYEAGVAGDCKVRAISATFACTTHQDPHLVKVRRVVAQVADPLSDDEECRAVVERRCEGKIPTNVIVKALNLVPPRCTAGVTELPSRSAPLRRQRCATPAAFAAVAPLCV